MTRASEFDFKSPIIRWSVRILKPYKRLAPTCTASILGYLIFAAPVLWALLAPLGRDDLAAALLACVVGGSSLFLGSLFAGTSTAHHLMKQWISANGLFFEIFGTLCFVQLLVYGSFEPMDSKVHLDCSYISLLVQFSMLDFDCLYILNGETWRMLSHLDAVVCFRTLCLKCAMSSR
ncbi:uncharacterized protein LACBIDRAFT_318233 [Laccaria bicolor S238N-H82]|uniref:Predicted protein n=1 Tax=Laccaria bicolor (strain S238N-H82 / ATCC MYA-4686) TaxID=486041 RepID=B0D693_LACBS|nr:uncharacterized protein LACBIDRAFT_318233 [Laccaria bicolor S238N-H82]EDR09905.1 predicted protein [Laccaria bicolor S238N-H82]|eukprot:XP_001879290.1 predicted protein [Laccaria bicolor S238N-H82]